MKKLFWTMAALSALVAAAPAAAQYRGTYGRAQIDSRITLLDARIESGRQRGRISREEARWLRDQVWQLRRLNARYVRSGLSPWERDELRRRINDLRRAVRDAELYRIDPFGRGGWWDRNADGWDDRDLNRDGRWDVDRSFDRNSDGWDDRDYDRDGYWQDDVSGGARAWSDDWDFDDDRWDDDRWDDDGRWGDDDRWDDDRRWQSGARLDTGLRIGVRAPINMPGVPPEYRSRYPDGGGVYYRYDDGQIFQIDARTNVILRIIPLGS
jgi:hypothetical protein